MRRAWPGPLGALRGFILSLALQFVVEYYWHVAMHWRPLYARFHSLHHFSKAPTPFDDLLIHPLEAAGYYCILYSPAFVVPDLFVGSFLLYMAVCGVCGVTDHCGLALRCGSLYNAAEHDLHHSAGFGAGVYVNLGFPFMIMDRLHGTFVPCPAKPTPSMRKHEQHTAE